VPVNDHGNDNGRARAVTIRDVAARAGVSRQTVSRAINGKGEISAATRERVLAAVRALGYRPSSIARGLKTSRTLTIGLVVPDIANPFFAEMARGAAAVAHREGYGVLLCNTDEDSTQEWAVLRLLEDHRVDGLVLCSSRLDEDSLSAAVARWRPLVLVNRSPAQALPGLGAVRVADCESARQVVRYLHGLGHRGIAFVGGTGASHSSRARREGYRAGLAELGLAGPAAWVADAAPTVEGGRIAAAALLRQQRDISALIAFNDLVAVGCLQACQSAGLAVPGDVSVVGWDDIVFAPYLSPPLTTVRLPKQELGARAMALLLALLGEADQTPEPLELPGELVVRQTTGPGPGPMHVSMKPEEA